MRSKQRGVISVVERSAATVTGRLSTQALDLFRHRPGRWPVAGASRLVLLSFLMLFVELALIRWTGSNVVYLAYFTNFILLASFLGIGVGFLRARAEHDLFRRVPLALVGFVSFTLVFSVTVSRGGGTRAFVSWFGSPALPMWVELPILFAGVVLVMAAIAQGVGRTFIAFSPLEAYRLDIFGSLLGIVSFSLLAFLGLPPVAWGLVAAAVILALLPRPISRGALAAIAGLVVLLGAESLVPVYRWSPYYKIEASGEADPTLAVRVNGLPHQSIIPIALIDERGLFYRWPYRHVGDGSPGQVLIIGAGTGNDVAVALSEGARSVDAIEIDPVLHDIGVDRHPDRPYQDPRVTSYVEDGRAFLHRTDARYDLILFALPDSLTGLTGYSALRLESFLLTRGALEEALDHLKPGGVFSMYNYYRPDVLDRFAHTLEVVFAERPCLDVGTSMGSRQQAVLTVTEGPGGPTDCERLWSPGSATTEPATDDRPFPYLRGRVIPQIYLVSITLILLASVLIVRGSSGPLRAMRPYVDLFFMGSAFLLLETKNVVQFALLYGTTWLVNALVFGGILASVLLAIEVARRVRLPRPITLYGVLLASLAAAWLIPQTSLLALAPVPRFLAATTLAFAPVFLANLVFAQRFKDVGSSAVAFGANLLGAMLGGVLEYTALITGYRFLLVLVAFLYLLAYFFWRVQLRHEPGEALGAVGVRQELG
jgi:SAM-dependent methyltransferase